MSELIAGGYNSRPCQQTYFYLAGDVLTDVSIWAGQTMYSAHRLVLALSSSYFRFVVTGTAQEGKFPVIFLKVSERLGLFYGLYFY